MSDFACQFQTSILTDINKAIIKNYLLRMRVKRGIVESKGSSLFSLVYQKLAETFTYK